MRPSAATSLDYSSDADPGIVRTMLDGMPVYRAPGGRAITGARTLARIAALVIPPAWTDVWICSNARGHLQATGKDARGRKQYRYHPRWTAERDSNKFDSLAEFARALPRIRRRVRRDLAQPSLCKVRVLAAIVLLMDRTFIRVGGERYRRENGSFGATTLRTRHVKLEGRDVVLDFRGKSGKRHRIAIDDVRVASVIRRCLDLPGHVLFQYRENDDARCITAADVNAYLREISGAPVTSKDFRTWGGTVCAAGLLAATAQGLAQTAWQAQVRDAVRAASRILGNTPAVCRRSYIHPDVLTPPIAPDAPMRRVVRGLRAAECEVLARLENAPARGARHAGSARRSARLPCAGAPREAGAKRAAASRPQRTSAAHA